MRKRFSVIIIILLFGKIINDEAHARGETVKSQLIMLCHSFRHNKTDRQSISWSLYTTRTEGKKRMIHELFNNENVLFETRQ